MQVLCLLVIFMQVTSGAARNNVSFTKDSLETVKKNVAAGKAVLVDVRSEEEWRALPQAEIVSRMPLFEIIKIGEAPPKPLPREGDRPLSGVRVLDLRTGGTRTARPLSFCHRAFEAGRVN